MDLSALPPSYCTLIQLWVGKALWTPLLVTRLAQCMRTPLQKSEDPLRISVMFCKFPNFIWSCVIQNCHCSLHRASSTTFILWNLLYPAPQRMRAPKVTRWYLSASSRLPCVSRTAWTATSTKQCRFFRAMSSQKSRQKIATPDTHPLQFTARVWINGIISFYKLFWQLSYGTFWDST